MDVEIVYDYTQPDEYWMLYGNVTGTLNSGVIGLEDPTGTKGLQYLYGGAPAAKRLTSSRTIHYFRPLVPAPAIVITFKAIVYSTAGTVIEPGSDSFVVKNFANYTVDVPYTGLLSDMAQFGRFNTFLPMLLR